MSETELSRAKRCVMTDGKVIEFPKTAEERKALAKARQDQAKQKLVDLFVERDLFHTSAGIAYADLILASVRQTWPVRSREFRFAYCKYLQKALDAAEAAGDELACVAAAANLKKPRVNEAIDRFEMRALTADREREVHLRVAADGGDLYIDLCDRNWQAIRITAAGWSVVQSPSVRFRRTRGMLPLPFPERGTSIDALRPFLNVGNDGEFNLVVAFILAALRDRGPYPILVLTGEQGSAKSTAARIVRGLIDPNSVPLSTLPPSSRDLFVTSNNSRVVAFDNVSRLSPLLSDNLARLATGGGYRIRKLFENTDETLIDAMRPVILNGIGDFVVRGDLQDRSIVLPFAPIKSKRVTEHELYAAFERQRAGIFGALLDLLVHGVRQLSETRLVDAPRMADFAVWAVACGLDGFEAAYRANRQNAIGTLLEHDALAQALLALVQTKWTGTATELLAALGSVPNIASPKTLSEALAQHRCCVRSGWTSVAVGRPTDAS
jgi:hypothetical protein